ncbi:Flp family type IVb pilin [Parasphingorhabdus sp. DH2-15]|uniref:Flp family type IVb pilin n=1 Tax=Parasphingorhabdus sp. DH2-15 TaxID=3444112 RepID=UPI003F6876CB
MLRTFYNVLQSRKGATAIEYGLIVALIAISAIVAMQNFGNASNEMWDTVERNIVN